MAEGFRVLVTGSRDWSDREAVWGALKQACDDFGADAVVIVHGGARGADALAAEYADFFHIRAEAHCARWNEFGKSAGYRRNAEMVALGADLCLAFIRDGSRGATHCAEAARKAGIPVRYYRA